MAAILLPNQTVSLIENDEDFNERNARLMWDRRQFCQLVKTGQQTSFQLRLTPHTGDNLVANGDFTDNTMFSWTVTPLPGFSWTAQNGESYYVPLFGSGVNHQVDISQNVPIQANRTYRLTFRLDFNDPFNAGGILTLIALLNSATVIGGEVTFQSSTHAPGYYTTYWRTDAAIVSNALSFTGLSTTVLRNIILDEIILTELTEPIVTLEKCDGTYVQDINLVQRDSDMITYYHHWNTTENLTEDECYRICILGTAGTDFNYLDLYIEDNAGNPIADGKPGGFIKFYS